MDTSRDPGSPEARGVAPLVLLASLALVSLLAVPGCLKPEAVVCPSGRLCPAGAKCAARQDVCIFDGCGDGVLQGDERCDDGNLFDADGCNSTCTSDETCGNGHKDPEMGEDCDDGNRAPGDGCDANCKRETCGNGQKDSGEQCDDGVGGEKRDSSGCDADCSYAVHGDGYPNLAAGEYCDGGPTTPPFAPDCISSTCNGNCTPSLHGDGEINRLDTSIFGHGEVCDGGRDTSATGTYCQSRTCNVDCTPSACGDGKRNTAASEDCDDGNLSSTDDCTAQCKVARCGDGLVDVDGVDTTLREACDLGTSGTLKNGDTTCPYGMTSCTGCEATCKAEIQAQDMAVHFCGDGTPDYGYGERCDAFRSSTCGTCTSACQPKGVQAATGWIDVVTTTVVDGDSLSIPDGIAPQPLTLEFDVDGACSTITRVHHCVDVFDKTRAEIETAIENAITGTAITTPSDGSNTRVTLENKPAGVAGNKPIVVTAPGGSVANASGAGVAIVVHGMTGGIGCPTSGLCADATDCVSGVCDQNGQCK